MGYSGTVPSEHSSGGKTRRGGITKTGNGHLRRVLIEAAWTYRHRPRIYGALRAPQEDIEEPVKAIAWKAQHRLHRRYRRLAERGLPHQRVVTAVGRELLGFIWAIGVHVERQHRADIFLTSHPCIVRSHRPASDRGHDDKENPRASYAVGPRPESARVVRDSSRRITTMKASLALDPRIAD